MAGLGFFNFQFTPSLSILANGFSELGIDIRSTRVPLQKAIREVMIPSFVENFRVGGRPSWQPLSEATISTKEIASDNLYPPQMELLRSGLLFNTIQTQSIWTTTRNEAIVQLPSQVAYGGVHQMGSPQARIPQRAFLVFQSEDMDKIQEIFADWVLERALEKLVF